MQIVQISLTSLRPHPRNSNVMPEKLLAKLTAHIAATDRYPPIIVRPMEDPPTTYQILDGHHRIEALRRLERTEANCVIWQVDDGEALLLMATLNRLQGQDDPHKRAALIATLAEHGGLKELAQRLPEDMAHLHKSLALHRAAPPPRPPQPLEQMPQAVHFFLLPAQRQRLDRKLKQYEGTREEALMQLVDEQ